MAYADWTITLTGSGATESAVVNSGRSSPLTVGGGFCRRLTTASNASENAFLRLSDAYSSGNFVGVPSTRAIRVQAALRTSVNPGSGCTAEVLMVTKAPQTYSSTNIYGLGLRVVPGGFGTGDPSIVLRTGGGSITSLTGVSLNTWYSLRMDVFPLGTGGDRIRCWRESVIGSGTWTLLYDTTIPSSSGQYVAWGGSTVQGLVYQLNSSGNASSSSSAFVDLFQAYVATAP